MNLRHLSDEALLAATERLVREERGILTSVLHHLREIERRRLFAALKYSSLFDYAVRGLGYSEPQAARRIAAMRLLKEMPEVEKKIESGALTLTHIGMAQTLFRQQAQSRESKKNLLQMLERTTKREAERIIAAKSPAPLAPDRIRAASEETIEIKFRARRSLQEKIERLKGVLAHSHPNIGLGELFELLVDRALMKKLLTPAPVKNTRQIWARDRGRCRNCGSTYALEIDHILPRAKGGGDDPENLRLLCRSCNQRAAIEAFGLANMEKHLEG